MTNFIIKYYRQIILICILLGLGFGSLIPFSETDPEIRNYVPSTMESRILTDKIETEFGIQDIVMVIFRDSTILTPGNLNSIRQIDRDISRLSGVTSRISPFTVRTITSTEGMMTADPLIMRIPSDPNEFAALEDEILKNRFAKDIVISSDMTSASITATINQAEPEKTTIQKIDSIIASHQSSAEVLTGGLPYIRQHIMKDVKRDALILVPIALFLMLLVLKLNLNDWRAVLMPFSVVLFSTALCTGMIPLLGWKLSIISLLVPVILIAVANNYGIYLVTRFQEINQRKDEASTGNMLKELTGTLNMPILFSGLTTIAGILGLLAHSIIPARQAGVLAATGVTAALIMSLLYIPAMIYAQKGQIGSKKQPVRQHFIFKTWLDKLSSVIVKYPGRIITGFAFATLIFALGITFIKIETNQENYFPKKSPVRMASDLINSKFGGSQTVSVMIEGDIKEPEIMNGIDRLTQRLETMDGVGNVFSISQAVREMSKAIYTDSENMYDRIPETRDGIAQMFELYNMSGDPDDFSQMMNLENTSAHVLVRLSNPDNKTINEVKSVISSGIKEIPGIVTVGGYAVIMNDFASSIIKGQVFSLIFAMLTVFILLALIFRSLKGGLTGTIPLAVSIVILVGFMGFTGIAIDAATALLSSIMIGVGVDFTIQFIWCFNSQIVKGLSYEESVRSSMRIIGRSIVINGLTVMSGFSVLIFSGFASIRFFGYLVIVSISSCLLGAIILVPAIIMKFRPQFVKKDMSKPKFIRHENKNLTSDIPGVAAFAPGSTRAGRGADHE
ncbi:MAG: MMPL family transporter [Bacteroidales bacterium]|nr:MMPL family transporter [Bacteroidales bacterium]